MKDHIVEIVFIVLAVIVLGLVWNNEKNKPAPEAPTLESQLQQQQAQ